MMIPAVVRQPRKKVLSRQAIPKMYSNHGQMISKDEFKPPFQHTSTLHFPSRA